MKRKLIITAGILIVVGVLLKLALVLISNQVLVQAKDDLVNVGSFQYSGVKTSLLDGEIVVSQPSFKHFKFKQDISADAATLHFDGILSRWIEKFLQAHQIDRVILMQWPCSVVYTDIALLNEQFEIVRLHVHTLRRLPDIFGSDNSCSL